MFSLTGKTALVTGAAKGIGKAVAKGFAGAGADVFVVDLMPAEETIKEIRALGVRCEGVVYDLREFAGYEKLAQDAADKMGGIDILANVAGLQIRHLCVDYPEADWDLVIDINTKAVFFLSQAVGRHMLKKGKGKIINIASVLAYQGGRFSPAYSASKGAVVQLSKSLANEWSSQGVNVNCIAPGYLDTDLNSAIISDPVRSKTVLERIPAGRWGKPEDIAGTAIYLASEASDYVHGAVIPVDGAWLSY